MHYHQCRPQPELCSSHGPTTTTTNQMNDTQLSLLGQLVAALDNDPVAQADLGNKLTNDLFTRYAEMRTEQLTLSAKELYRP